jgi:murein DD-endopeptidase MepM/ murein hydrolase activator NlpD
MKLRKDQSGFSHIEAFIIIVVLVAVGAIGYRVYKHSHQNKNSYNTAGVQAPSNSGGNLGDPNSTNPITKGLSLSNGECTGSGSTTLTHAPMNVGDISDIQPMGLMTGAHVTPVDHEYYFGANQNAPIDTYPVYADANGTIVAVEKAPNGNYFNWWITIAHSCTFLSNYNLMTSIAPSIKAALPSGWGPNSNGGVHIPVKAGEIIGYVGHQSLDFQVWNTQKTLKGLLNPTAYNNAEPWKVNTVAPLDYFSSAVKAQIQPLYVRSAAPLDGKIDYDVKGEAVGNWFLDGTNGYAGQGQPGAPGYSVGHLALAYDSVDPSALVFSIGNYQGQPAQFAVKGNVDWTKITQSSGVVKLELTSISYFTPPGQTWSGQLANNITMKAGQTQGTALIQLTGAEDMKVEVFPGLAPAKVSGFDAAAKSYNRGQDAHMIKSNTAT